MHVKKLVLKMDEKELSFEDVEVTLVKESESTTVIRIKQREKSVEELAKELNEELENLLLKLKP